MTLHSLFSCKKNSPPPPPHFLPPILLVHRHTWFVKLITKSFCPRTQMNTVSHGLISNIRKYVLLVSRMKTRGHTIWSFSRPTCTTLIVVVAVAMLVILALPQVDARDILSRWKRSYNWGELCKMLKKKGYPQPPQCRSNANWS
ncbi:hypothetical protein RRG08_018411 [Elysia crispata]|uniref:Uncharacterized protein n=1 Tax=Elysia crispata TaxID=231223 RepID=A0AAE0YL51_9GAST|nr:hypothetical protein RRG08_018411 [Elysia crispata]